MQRMDIGRRNRLIANFTAALDLLEAQGREPDRWEEECLSYALGAMACGMYLVAEVELAAFSRRDVAATLPVRVEPRFRYNQAFESVFAIVPGSIMTIMALIPVLADRAMGKPSSMAVGMSGAALSRSGALTARMRILPPRWNSRIWPVTLGVIIGMCPATRSEIPGPAPL